MPGDTLLAQILVSINALIGIERSAELGIQCASTDTGAACGDVISAIWRRRHFTHHMLVCYCHLLAIRWLYHYDVQSCFLEKL